MESTQASGRRSGVKLWVVGAAVLLAAGLAALATGVATGMLDDDAPVFGRVVTLDGASGGAAGSAELRQSDGATEILLTASGLDPDRVYAVWLAPARGGKSAAGTFRPRDDGTIEIELLSSRPVAQTVRVWVTDPMARTVMRASLA